MSPLVLHSSMKTTAVHILLSPGIFKLLLSFIQNIQLNWEIYWCTYHPKNSSKPVLEPLSRGRIELHSTGFATQAQRPMFNPQHHKTNKQISKQRKIVIPLKRLCAHLLLKANLKKIMFLLRKVEFTISVLLESCIKALVKTKKRKASMVSNAYLQCQHQEVEEIGSFEASKSYTMRPYLKNEKVTCHFFKVF